MSARVYIRDLEALQHLDAELSQFSYGATCVLEDAERSTKAASERLKARTTYWQGELRRRQNALAACQRDDRRSCQAEADGVRQAEEAIEKLRRLSTRLEQVIGEYQPQANRLRQLLSSRMAKAKRDLGHYIAKYQAYLVLRSTHSGFRSSASGEAHTQAASAAFAASSDSKSSFSIANWAGYPGGPKPSGPFRIVSGEEYQAVRDKANAVNMAMHQANPTLKGLQIHEIQPIKFGGSPTDVGNKMALTPREHARFTVWWNRLQQQMEQG